MSVEDNKLNESVEAALAKTRTQDSGMPEGCIADESLEPCGIVIVGASGDLTVRKLVPALFNLYLNDGLPDPFLIVGCSRTKMSDQDFRNKMEKGLDAAGKLKDVVVFHAGTAEENGKIVATGGRVLNVTALGKTAKAAQKRAYQAVDLIDWPEGFCRRDIGWRAV